VGHLQRALESRAVFDQAKGILMSRHGMSADAAFDLLSKESQLVTASCARSPTTLVDEVQLGED
jgi:hypothetical protein